MEFNRIIISTFFLIASIINAAAGAFYNFEGGVGFGAMNNGNAICSKFGMEIRFDNFVNKARVVTMDKTLDNKPSFGQYLEAGLLPGIMLGSDDKISLHLHAGLSFIYFVEWRDNYDQNIISEPSPHTYRTIGMPIEIEFMVLPLDNIGIGFSLMGNINMPNSFAGCAISLHYGKLR
jgi:hypothetical protein